MKPFLKVIFLLCIPLVLILAYSMSSIEVGGSSFVLEKADLSTIRGWLPQSADPAPLSADTLGTSAPLAADTLVLCPDSVCRLDSVGKSDSLPVAQTPSDEPKPLKVAAPDSTKFRILFFGDSMLEGLARRMCDYTMENGYDLTSVIWYSSSTKLWAETDTLQFFLDRVRPDYVCICLGSNELFVRDLEKRDRYIGRIVDKLSGYPFVWISPPNWKEDSGINQLIINHVGLGRYFDSRYLDLERSSDHAHPTRTAAALWMDTVAVWMSSPAAKHRLRMDRPTESRPRKFHQYVLKPVN